MLENRSKIDFCAVYEEVPTLHCQNNTHYKVDGQPEDKYVHCTETQELNVDKNNHTYDENCF